MNAERKSPRRDVGTRNLEDNFQGHNDIVNEAEEKFVF